MRGGGSIEPPKTGGGGSGKRAQLTGPFVSHYEHWRQRRRNFLPLKMVKIFFTKYIANDDFSEPPRRADSENPIFSFCRFLGPGHLRGLGVSLGRILEVLSIEPFWGGGGGLARGLYRPPPLN